MASELENVPKGAYPDTSVSHTRKRLGGVDQFQLVP